MELRRQERIYEHVFLACALTAVVLIGLIFIFVAWQGLPVFQRTGLWSFISGSTWQPLQSIFGVLPMIAGSIAVTLGSLVLGVPLGVATAIFLAEISPPQFQRVVRPAVELLASIPSVIYGLFGMTLVVPLIRAAELAALPAGLPPHYKVGYSVLAAAIILAIMILPTITSIAEDAIRAVPGEYREGSLALGATHWQTIVRVVLPASKSGIIAAVILGMGRSIGETMAVIMVAGNSVLMPLSIFSPVRTLTGNIAIESAYASGLHQQSLFATGVVLFAFIFALEVVAWLVRRQVRRV